MQRDRLGTLLSINAGMPAGVSHGNKQVETGIFKQPLAGAVMLSYSGLQGDGQADLVNHGGPDKAVCVYTNAHASYWSSLWNKSVEFAVFGENFTISDGLETEVCIGDIIEVGEAVVQVSQPRLPCFKLAIRHGLPELPEQVQQTGFTGYYFRVLKEGTVIRGDELVFQSHHPAALTVKEAADIMLAHRDDLALIRKLHDIQELAASWRTKLAERITRLTSEKEGGTE
jgi:MOSC domain-containing protein YiiM